MQPLINSGRKTSNYRRVGLGWTGVVISQQCPAVPSVVAAGKNCSLCVGTRQPQPPATGKTPAKYIWKFSSRIEGREGRGGLYIYHHRNTKTNVGGVRPPLHQQETEMYMCVVWLPAPVCSVIINTCIVMAHSTGQSLEM